MKITKHGAKRVYDRTAMTPEEVLFLISNEFAVRLESERSPKAHYYLFYSPPDEDTKIAVVSKDGATLITVWEKDYILSRGVQKVTPDLESKARALLEEAGERSGRQRLHSKIDVRIGPGVVYTHDCGEILFKGKRTTESVSVTLSPQLLPIATLVEENRDTSGDRITYLIRLFNPRTLCPARPFVMLKHTNLLEQMLPTA
jgi:hypothetical protein